MNKRTEQQFQKIADDAIRAAEQVSCPLEVFAEGLALIEDAVRERREMEK